MSSTKRYIVPPVVMRGFSLLETVVVLVIIGLIYMIWSNANPWINEEQFFEKSRAVLAETENALVLFSRTNNRLPCPDTSVVPNGLEGSGVTAGCSNTDVTGSVPWRSLLLSDQVLDAHSVPVTYSVYRNVGDDADLADDVERIDIMDDVNINDIIFSRVNICDFCEALRNASNATANSSLASVSTQITAGGCAAGNYQNQAFILTSSGLENADGDGSDELLDEENTTAPLTCYASPQQGRSRNYDDIVAATSFVKLTGAVCRTPICLGPNTSTP